MKVVELRNYKKNILKKPIEKKGHDELLKEAFRIIDKYKNKF